jgi:hypothetical protein
MIFSPLRDSTDIIEIKSQGLDTPNLDFFVFQILIYRVVFYYFPANSSRKVTKGTPLKEWRVS